MLCLVFVMHMVFTLEGSFAIFFVFSQLLMLYILSFLLQALIFINLPLSSQSIMYHIFLCNLCKKESEVGRHLSQGRLLVAWVLALALDSAGCLYQMSPSNNINNIAKVTSIQSNTEKPFITLPLSSFVQKSTNLMLMPLFSASQFLFTLQFC